ncbi:MAG: hypothetical protein ACFE9T_00930 [Promethearchaeota archaeon]
MLTNLKPSVKEPLIIYGSGLIITIISVIFFSITGYPLITTATETLNAVTPPLYMISIFFPYGILLGELVWIWEEKKELDLCFLFFIECIILALFSFIRYISSIPFSGHTIILSFYISHQVINNKFHYPIRFLVGLIVLIITLIYKIIIWSDPITFLMGALLGIGIWFPGFLYRLKKNKNELFI